MANLTRQDKAQIRAGGGSAVLPLPGGDRPQPKAVYYDRYGNKYHNLPADPWSIEHYGRRGWSLAPPSQVEERPKPAPVGVSDDVLPRMPMAQAPVGPVATYYQKDGTAIEGLPADPQSMAQYLEMGLSLSKPARGRKRAE